MSDALLTVQSLKTWIDADHGVVRAVDGVDFSIAAGETFALLGESGCGKSMTALSLMRLLPDNAHVVAGSALLRGTDLFGLPESGMRDLRGGRVAMIFQEPATSLNPVLSVGRQITETLQRHTDLAGDALRRRALELLDAVGLPDRERRLDEYPFQLSGGMKQRVMIAMALACSPDLLIADEPTTALDVTIQAQVLQLLRDLQASTGMAMLLITHDLGVVAEMAQRIGVMYAGQLVEVASRTQFFASPRHPYSRKLFDSLPAAAKRGGSLAVIRGSVPSLAQEFAGCRFVERCEHAQPRCSADMPMMLNWAEGEVRCWLYPGGEIPAPSETAAAGVAGTPPPRLGDALEVRDLKVHFPIRRGLLRSTVGHVRAVDGVSLDIAAGSTVALVGESGCGKTTVGKALLRLLHPTGGDVRFGGADLGQLSATALRLQRRDMQIIFQDPYASLNPRMRVIDILDEGMASLGVGGSRAERQARATELLQEVGLDAAALGRYPHEFSGGQRQRIAIARALAVQPKLIVCDEPTSALDVSVQAQILNLLKRLQSAHGLSYLFITHNLAVVEYLAHEVAVMYLGRIVERGRVDEVLGAPKHPYTQALLAAIPRLDGAGRLVRRLHGDPPSPAAPPAGCHFHPRCPHAADSCRVAYPQMRNLSASHAAACVLVAEARSQ